MRATDSQTVPAPFSCTAMTREGLLIFAKFDPSLRDSGGLRPVSAWFPLLSFVHSGWARTGLG